MTVLTHHPCPWTAIVLATIEPILEGAMVAVHDPFAGAGERLGRGCDDVGVPFTGTEIESEFIVDPRVQAGDSTDPATYPDHLHMVVTSPVYPNGMADHFRASDDSRRHTYRQGLASILGYDRPLHENNMGRYSNRHRGSRRTEATHFDIARRCVEHWPPVAVVNVKNVKGAAYEVDVVERWGQLLEEHGCYSIADEIEVKTSGQRYGANGHLRVDHEVILVAVRLPDGSLS